MEYKIVLETESEKELEVLYESMTADSITRVLRTLQIDRGITDKTLHYESINNERVDIVAYEIERGKL